MKKVFIITGANRGLGKALVDHLIKNEQNFIISISRSLSEDQKSLPKENFYFLQADLSKKTLSNKIIILKELINKQDIYFINNASIIEPITKIEFLDDGDIDNILSVNIKSTMLITKYLLSYFKHNKLSFVNISSGAAKRPINSWSLYCSSKAFIEMFFNVAKKENEQHRFFTIDPGVMDTNMQKNIRETNFPNVSSFRNLEKEGNLKSTEDVALEIINSVL